MTKYLVLALLVGCAHRDPGGESPGDANTGTSDGRTGSTADAAPLELAIAPLDPTLDVTGTPASVPFTATFAGQTLDNVVWSLDDVKVGVIDGTGAFRSQGLVAGSVTVTARYGAYSTSTTLRVRARIVENTGNVSPTDQATLDTGGTADAAFKWLYPYDRTVFPRNIPSPFLQFAGGNATAMRVTIDLPNFSYVGYWAASTPASATVPEAIWKAAQASASGSASEDVVVTATKLASGVATGPIAETWRVAPGNLKGIIYYNTYKSALTNTGAVMKLKPGRPAEVLIGQCTVCHSVSADGSTIAAGLNWQTDNPLDSGSFTLSTTAAPTQNPKDADGRKFAFAALTPDGTKAITNGVPTGARPRGLTGPYASSLIDAKTGATISAPTFTSQVSYASSPAFSPDGKHLAFNWGEKAAGKTLAAMDVDWTTSPPTFGAPYTLRTAPTGVAAWPSYFPDGTGVVYHEGDRFDTVNGSNGGASYAEIKLFDTQDNSLHALPALNGWQADGTTSYLPYGSSEENRRNYEPSVLPLPVGGYYWVMFTSRRAYGNTLAPGGTVAGTDNEWGGTVNGVETPSKRKKIWIAAIDVNYHGLVDPSHPAFYLDGQELDAGNMRAYASLDVCHPEGDSCESGADCCTGFCRQTETDAEGNPVLSCVAQPADCSQIDETCQADADCCDVVTGATCINNRCAVTVIF